MHFETNKATNIKQYKKTIVQIKNYCDGGGYDHFYDGDDDDDDDDDDDNNNNTNNNNNNKQ